MSQVNFLTQNPVLAGMDRAEARQGRADQRALGRATDDAARSVLNDIIPGQNSAGAMGSIGSPPPAGSGAQTPAPGPTPSAPPSQTRPPASGGRGFAGDVNRSMAERLARSRVPGAGTAALRHMQISEQQRDRYETLALQALGKGDQWTYDHYAKRAGMELPPEMLNNARVAGLISRAGLLSKQFFPGKGNGQIAAAFAKAFIESNGDPTAAYQAVMKATGGKGPAGNASGSFSPVYIQDGDRSIVANFNRKTGQVQAAVGPDGKPIARAPSQQAIKSGKTLDQAAHDYAKGVAMKAREPAEYQSEYNKAFGDYKKQYGAGGAPLPATPQAPAPAPQAAPTAASKPPGTTVPIPRPAPATGGPASNGAAGPAVDPRVEQARQAIANGADPAAVKQRMQQLGLNPALLGQ